MATSGTYNFDLTLEEIIEEAYDRCGIRSSAGYDYKTALRSLDLLLIEWNNRGTNFWTLEQDTVPLVQGTTSYTLDAQTFEIVECVIRTGSGTSQTDIPLTRISVSQYATIPNKNTQGRPVNIWLDKQGAAPDLYVWPTPDKAYTMVYWRLRRIEDAGSPASNTADVPYRFLPAMTAGLASKLATKKLGDMNRINMLKSEYESAWLDAVAGDRDRSSWRVRPYKSVS